MKYRITPYERYMKYFLSIMHNLSIKQNDFLVLRKMNAMQLLVEFILYLLFIRTKYMR